ncbi:MAG: hypothetical protein JXJ04_03265 [Spirochaetales bacterium]|nr:hypothetical protein [Spirochaetales bacterium]
MKKVFACFLIFMICGIWLFPDVPEEKEEVIYSVTYFNGLHYARNFCKENSDTIYLLANTSNFLVIKKTMTYFWPLTKKYLVDAQRLNIVFDGTLEIEQNNKIIKTLKTVLYIIYNDPGLYKNNWKVFVGNDAEAESKRLEEIMRQYELSYSEYLTKQKIYESAKEKLIEKMQEYNDRGRDTSKLVNQYKALIQPVPPINPTPEELSVGKQFVINLPAGEYKIRLRNTDGKILQGSEKNLFLFKERREGVVGYRIVPGDRWTKPDKSQLPSHILYVNPTTDIYIIPFLQNEYNDLYYEKMMDNNAQGNPTFYRWEEIKEIPLSKLEIRKGDESTSIELKEFYAEKLKGTSSLGYKIVPYEPEGAHKDKSPAFTGFKIPLERKNSSITFKLQDARGKYYNASTREIRIVLKSNSYIALVIFTFLPLLVMAIVLLVRQKQYRQGKQG